jgi:hypothetical protein
VLEELTVILVTVWWLQDTERLSVNRQANKKLGVTREMESKEDVMGRVCSMHDAMRNT